MMAEVGLLVDSFTAGLDERSPEVTVETRGANEPLVRALPRGHSLLLSLTLALGCSQGDFTEIAQPGLQPVDLSSEEPSNQKPDSIEGERPPLANAAGTPVRPSVRKPDGPQKPSAVDDPSTQQPQVPVSQEQTVDAAVPPTLAPFLGLPETLDYETGKWATESAFPNLTFDDPVAMEQAPRTNMLYLAEREGRIYAFENNARTETKVLALDLGGVTQGEGDSGLLGLVFHPAFGLPDSPNRDYVYVHYAYTETPIIGTRPEPARPSVSRLARFSVDPATHIIDRASELVLIDQSDDDLNHQGGAMFFHPSDGFLYLALGDEGGTRCSLQNCQTIEKDLFSGVLRIDVDMRGGSISHPIAKQPSTGTTANYFIPNDNPFVGQPGVLEEFFALGLRSPHRMTYDVVGGLAWIGDVGQTLREEIDVLQAGANYQWPIIEGLSVRQPMPDSPPLGSWTDPVFELQRDQSIAVIGGYVYRANTFPELQGRYVFGDYMTGTVWSLSYAIEANRVRAKDLEVVLAPGVLQGRITSFAVDANRELYILKLGSGSQVQRLVAANPHVNAPLDTSGIEGIVEGIPDEEHTFRPYEVRSPLWSDGAVKQRWFWLPPGETIGFSDAGAWVFPVGTVFVKHFAMALDERRPTELTPLETRFLVAARGGGYYGITYQWDGTANSPSLVLAREDREIESTLADGSTRRQRYEFPGPSDCLVCHSQKAGYVLGARTEQLNREGAAEPFDNQLVAWSRLGLFDRVLEAADVSVLPALANVADLQASPEERVRSYWASNCSMCHGVDQDIRAQWDARYSTPLESQGVVLGGLVNPLPPTNVVMVVPGDLRASEMYRRINTTERTAGAMPPIGRRLVDQTFAAAMRNWIESLTIPADVGDAGSPVVQ